MKSRWFKVVLIAFLAATSSLLVGAQHQASNLDTLTQREAKAQVQSAATNKHIRALVASAKTAEDHLELAAYFNQEADRLDADAKRHQDLAEVYRENPGTTGGGKQSGRVSIFRTAEHCDSARNALGEAAKNLRELAAEHEQMAKDVAK